MVFDLVLILRADGLGKKSEGKECSSQNWLYHLESSNILIIPIFGLSEVGQSFLPILILET